MATSLHSNFRRRIFEVLLLSSCCLGLPLRTTKEISEILDNHTEAIGNLKVYVRKKDYINEWFSKNERVLDDLVTNGSSSTDRYVSEEDMLLTQKELHKMVEESFKGEIEKQKKLELRIANISEHLASLDNDYNSLERKYEAADTMMTSQRKNDTERADEFSTQWSDLVTDVEELKKGKQTVYDVIDSQSKSQKKIYSVEVRLMNAERIIAELVDSVKRVNKRQEESSRSLIHFHSTASKDYNEMKSRLEKLEKIVLNAKMSEPATSVDISPDIPPKMTSSKEKLPRTEEDGGVPFPQGFLDPSQDFKGSWP